MKTLIAVLLCTALCWDGLNAQCPDPATLKDVNGAKVCARMFSDSTVIYAQSCQGDSLDSYPGDDIPTISLRWNNRVSSLVVSRFCSLTVWSRFRKQGVKRKFSAGIQHRLKDVGQGLGILRDWDNDISGYWCVC